MQFFHFLLPTFYSIYFWLVAISLWWKRQYVFSLSLQKALFNIKQNFSQFWFLIKCFCFLFVVRAIYWAAIAMFRNSNNFSPLQNLRHFVVFSCFRSKQITVSAQADVYWLTPENWLHCFMLSCTALRTQLQITRFPSYRITNTL